MTHCRLPSLLLLLLGLMPASVFPLLGCGSVPQLVVHDASEKTAASDAFAFGLMDGSDFAAAADTRFDQGSWSCSPCDSEAPAELTRRFSVAGVTSYTVQANLLLRAGHNRANLIGVSNQVAGSTDSATSRFLAGFDSSGFGYEADGTWTQLASHAKLGGNGWYTVTVAYTGQDTSISIAPYGSIHALTFSLPATGVANADTMVASSAATADRQQLLRYAVSAQPNPQLTIPNFTNIPNLLAAYTLPGQRGSYAVLPGSYQPETASRWVVYLHGYGELGSDIFTRHVYSRMTEALVKAGYVAIAMNNTTQNCYGNAQCDADVEALIGQWRASLNLAPHPYLMGDSMGGFTMLNAISHGSVSPAAAVGWSININLASTYQQPAAAKHITDAYNISDDNPYAAATATYDPMLQPATVYAVVPMMVWSSYHDKVVPRDLNADAFAARVNGAGGGVQVIDASGGHLDESNFDPKAVLRFFQSH